MSKNVPIFLYEMDMWKVKIVIGKLLENDFGYGDSSCEDIKPILSCYFIPIHEMLVVLCFTVASVKTNII